MLAFRLDVEHVAVPFDSDTLPFDPQPEIPDPFAVNVTVPVGVIPPVGALIVSVNVTVALRLTGLEQSVLVGSVEEQVRLVVAEPTLTATCTAELGELA